MKTKDQLPVLMDQETEKEIASPRGPLPRLAFARFDQLPLLTIPQEVCQGGEEVLRAIAHDLYSEGGRGPAAKRLLSREVAIALGQYRYRTALANILLEPVLKNGKGDPKQLDAIERQVNGAHRRLMDALDRLARIDIMPAPRVSVTAHGNTQVNVVGAHP